MNNLNWYCFDQNNSFGYFDVNDKVCHRLFIEAESFQNAVEKAEELGCYWHGVDIGIDCPCCGDRWSKWDDAPVDFRKHKGLRFDNIEDYAQYIADEYGWTTPDARIYYHDGNVKEIFKR